MEFLSLDIILTGLAIFVARIADVSLGTLRTISTIRGNVRSAFLLGLLEVVIWLAVITKVLTDVTTSPMLALFYAFGFSTGNVVGIIIERQYISPRMVIRVVTPHSGHEMALKLREWGYEVYTFDGHGAAGPITEAWVFCHRKDMRRILNMVKDTSPEAFYITEQASVARFIHPAMAPPTGWRAVLKKK